MDKLQLPHAKLFYFSAELYKNQTISENEKLKMKEMVINDEPQIFELLERYQSSGNEQEFVNSLLQLLRPHQKAPFNNKNSNNNNPSQIQAEPIDGKGQFSQTSKPTNGYQQQQQSNYMNAISSDQEQQYYPLEKVQYPPQQSNQQQLSQQSQQQPQQHQKGLNAQQESIAQFIEKHPDCPDEISSPLGLKLLKRKQKAQKNTTQIKDYLKPYKIDQE